MPALLDAIAEDEGRLGRLLATYRTVAGRPDAAAEAAALAAQLSLEVHAYAIALRERVYPALPSEVDAADPAVHEGLDACQALAARAAAETLPVPVRDGLVAELGAMLSRQSAYQAQRLWPLLPNARRATLARAYRGAVDEARARWGCLRAGGEVDDEDGDPVG